MQRNECKPGTEVIIRGKIIFDDKDTVSPISVEIEGQEYDKDKWFDPAALEPSAPKYDPKRKFRKGDLVKITGYRGRPLFAPGGDRKLAQGYNLECVVTLEKGEDDYGIVVLPYGVLEKSDTLLHVACIELVKPIEEIEAERPYKVKNGYYFFRVQKEASYIYEIWWKSEACPSSPYSEEEARKKAQEICDDLNRKHQESLNA